MAVALAMAPAYTIRFRMGPLPLTLLEVVLVIAILAGALAFRHELAARNAYTWPALLLLLAATLDTVFAPDLRAGLGLWKAYFVEPLAAGLVILSIARDRGRARLLLAGVGVATVAAAAVNIAVDGGSMLAGTFNTTTPQVAIYNSANAIPLFLEPPAAFALALALHGDDRRERVAAGVVYMVAALAIVLSYSRLGWITLLAMTVFVASFSRWRAWVLAGSAAVVAAALGASSSARHRVLIEFDPNSTDNTVRLRFLLWRSAINMLEHRPLLGGGLGGFKQAVEPFRDPSYGEDLIYPHNLALNFWSETGPAGLAAFAWLCVQVVRVGRRCLAGGPWARALGIGLLAMLLSVLLHGLGDVPYFKNDQSLIFWALAAIPLAAAPSGARSAAP